MKATVQKIESLIRSAQVREARRELSQFRTQKVPREFVLPLAKHCRSANLPELGIKLLNPYVRPSVKSVYTAHDSEKAVYAACLTRIGAANEALTILRSLNSENPERLLFEAYALVSQWNYRESIRVLKRFVQHPKTDNYQRLVGQVNLAAAYVHEQLTSEASSLLERLRDETQSDHYSQLYGNTLELSAQHAILNKQWKEASHFLKLAEDTLRKSGGLDFFFVEKWVAIMKALKPSRDLCALRKIRKEARHLKHWETVRDCDRILALTTQDEKLFLKLYFGTPFPEFRNYLTKSFNNKFPIPNEFVWYPGGKEKGPVLDLTQLKSNQGSKSGLILHRLLTLLSSDFYRPIRLATLHAFLYEGEHFNPRSAPTRVHQAIKRLRQWLEKDKIPLIITEERSSYVLNATGNLGIKVLSHSTPLKRQDLLLNKLKASFPRGTFGINEAATCLGTSLRTTNRVLQQGEVSGSLVKEGKASKTRYRF